MPTHTNSRKMARLIPTTLFLIGLLCLIHPTAAMFGKKNKNKKSNNSNQNKANALVKWLRTQKGGYFNDKIAYQPISEANANIGLYAVKDLKKDEQLIVIPRQALLTATSDQDTAAQVYMKQDMCYTTWNLVRAYKKVQQNKKTNFEGYVRYIFGDITAQTATQNKRQQHLPSAWSPAAQEMLHIILGHELGPRLLGTGQEPASMTDTDFFDSCRHLLEDQEEHEDMDFDWDNTLDESRRLFQDAWWTVISRSWNEVMIPVYDIVNHRNGDWHNMDQATSAHEGPEGSGPVVVVALRDVAAGEPLHISYNECLDSDCYGMEHSYVLPHILKDYGFVEQYPRRWRIDLNDDENGDEHVVFEIDQEKDDSEKLILRWLSSSPEPDALNLEQVIYLQGHLIRQRELKDDVSEGVKDLESEHERETIVEFHEALITALQMVLDHANPKQSQLQQQQKKCADVAGSSGDETCQALYYDDLIESSKRQLTEDGKEEEEEDPNPVCSGDSSLYLGRAPYETIDETASHYQGIRYEHNAEMGETCLYLSDWLQTCSSFRPHYHESVVHIPASYVDEVKRVIYLGGGDNYMLHEILKYPSLELVMGFELDQQVVRSSFKNLGTQPSFEDERVQWWFGDATKSLSMLPHDYWGTFDLVIVDLQTNVAETLQVSQDMTIMDAAMRLMKTEGGVLSRNEDFYPRRSVGFAKYEVDIELFDVPVLCQQSITMGSKTVDFLRKEPKEHGIDTVYVNKNKKEANAYNFGDWFNYRNNPAQESPECQESKAEDTNVEEELESMATNRGFHLIIEVEEASSSNESTDTVREHIRKALSEAGLKQKSLAVSSVDEDVTLFLLQEGYVLVQRWKDEKYFAFDVKLWSHYGNAETIKHALKNAVDGTVTTSYRIVAGGMSGLPKTGSADGTLPKFPCEKSSTVAAEALSSKDTVSTVVTRETMSLVQGNDSAVVVLCGERSSPCESLDAMATLEKRTIQVRGCSANGSIEEMMTCEDGIVKLLKDSTSVQGKIGAIVVDSGTSKASGQILHRILSDKSRRNDLLEHNYVVLSFSSDLSASWRSGLIERFQSDFDVFSPAYKSQIFFNDTISSLRVDLFSSGDSKFFSHLGGVLKSVEKETGISGEVRNVADGMINYVADFSPSVVSNNDDYDLEDSLRQWHSQSPMEHQTIMQFQVETPMTPLAAGEAVLVEETQDVWKGSWIPGTVVDLLENGEYLVALDDFQDEEMEVPRSALRRFETESAVEERELILFRRGFFWSQGAVIGKLEDGSFKLRTFDTDGDVLMAQRKDIVKRFEASATSHLPSMSAAALREAFTKALALNVLDFGVSEEDITAFDGVAGDGSIIVAFSSVGVAIATWDGQAHIEINLFTEVEHFHFRDDFSEALKKEAPFLLMTSRDEMPRGRGRVVVWESDIDQSPDWTES